MPIYLYSTSILPFTTTSSQRHLIIKTNCVLWMHSKFTHVHLRQQNIKNSYVQGDKTPPSPSPSSLLCCHQHYHTINKIQALGYFNSIMHLFSSSAHPHSDDLDRFNSISRSRQASQRNRNPNNSYLYLRLSCSRTYANIDTIYLTMHNYPGVIIASEYAANIHRTSPRV